jgi:hypothetical protein
MLAVDFTLEQLFAKRVAEWKLTAEEIAINADALLKCVCRHGFFRGYCTARIHRALGVKPQYLLWS